MSRVTWKLYYGDRTIFSSEDGDWSDAPYLNVAGLAVPDAITERQIVTGDFYVFPPYTEQPYSPELMGLLDYLQLSGFASTSSTLADLSLDDMERFGVKLGRMYDNDAWRDLWDWMVADADAVWSWG